MDRKRVARELVKLAKELSSSSSRTSRSRTSRKYWGPRDTFEDIMDLSHWLDNWAENYNEDDLTLKQFDNISGHLNDAFDKGKIETVRDAEYMIRKLWP